MGKITGLQFDKAGAPVKKGAKGAKDNAGTPEKETKSDE